MSGGKPGYYPTFDLSEPRDDLCAPLGWGIAHPMPLNLYDPFGFSKNRTPEEKAKGLVRPSRPEPEPEPEPEP